MTDLLLRLFVKDKDNPSDPAVRAAVGSLSGTVGIVCNLLLFVGKLLVGMFAASVSITADALNNLSDATSSIVTLMGLLNLGNVLNAGFDQIFNLYSPSVYSTGDIIDTFVYRLGLEQAQFSVSTAVGLFKSVISIIMVSLSNYLAGRYANYRVF